MALDTLLGDLEDDLERSKDATGQSAGPLGDPEKSDALDGLSSAESTWDSILDDTQYDFSASTVEAQGYADLPAYALNFHQLAKAASIEGQKATPDMTLIGSKLKTMRARVGEYRDLINDGP